MTDPRVGEIEARLAAATPGPWNVYRNDREVNMWVLSGDGSLECNLGYLGNRPENDAEFIAAAPADVAYLLAELRKAHEALLLHESFRDLIMALAEKWEMEFPSKAADLRAAVAAANGREHD